MFDIGFSELVLIGIVALLVIGPEHLPETVRTAMVWLNRIRRGFNEIKQEVQQELHNDAVMRDLRKTGEQLKNETAAIGRDLTNTIAPPTPDSTGSRQQDKERDKSTPENKSE
jgi:sec-independent protein translocase protein TatB